MCNSASYSLIAWLVFISSSAFGQNAIPTFSSREAREAKARYVNEERRLEADFQSKRSELRIKYLADLESAKVAAARAANLEEAVRIREEIDRTKLTQPIMSGTEKFAAELADSAWINVVSGNAVAFKSDNSIKASWHNEAGMWVATGERKATVLMTKNRIVQSITFDKDGMTFTDFEGNVYKRVK